MEHAFKFTFHLNGKTKSKKMGPRGVFPTKDNVKVIKWTLVMQKCELSNNV
jgi:hypothetical protein